jgi:hypothetical protein
MKMPLSLGVFAFAGFIAPVAVVGQRNQAGKWGAKGRPAVNDPHYEIQLEQRMAA